MVNQNCTKETVGCQSIMTRVLACRIWFLNLILFNITVACLRHLNVCSHIKLFSQRHSHWTESIIYTIVNLFIVMVPLTHVLLIIVSIIDSFCLRKYFYKVTLSFLYLVLSNIFSFKCFTEKIWKYFSTICLKSIHSTRSKLVIFSDNEFSNWFLTHVFSRRKYC